MKISARLALIGCAASAGIGFAVLAGDQTREDQVRSLIEEGFALGSELGASQSLKQFELARAAEIGQRLKEIDDALGALCGHPPVIAADCQAVLDAFARSVNPPADAADGDRIAAVDEAIFALPPAGFEPAPNPPAEIPSAKAAALDTSAQPHGAQPDGAHADAAR